MFYVKGIQHHYILAHTLRTELTYILITLQDVDGWYYLLTEEVGRRKHLQAQPRPKPVLTATNAHNIPQINKAVEGQERIVVSSVLRNFIYTLRNILNMFVKDL